MHARLSSLRYSNVVNTNRSCDVATLVAARMKIDDTSVQELDAKETKVLGDWRNTFEVKKGYPIVGKTGNGIDVELP